MRVVILTSIRKGTAAYCLPLLLEQTGASYVQVIYSQGVIRNKGRHYRQKLKKLLKIGLLGAINGVRMRKWYAGGNPNAEDIEDVCKRNNIPFTIVPGINTPQTYELMKACKADLGLSLGNSYISSKVFSAPVYGMLNIHGEVLPDFQNAQSVIWQIYEGSRETGYTIHKVEKRIDTGEIYKQERFPILMKETLGETVAATCAEILRRAAGGLVELINNFEEHDRNKRPQGQGRSYTTPSFRQYMRISRNFRKMRQSAQ